MFRRLDLLARMYLLNTLQNARVATLCRNFIFSNFFLFLFFSEYHSSHAIVADNAFLLLPSRFETQRLSTSSRGIGEICYSIAHLPDGSICNPAFLPDSELSQLLIQIFIGNGFTELQAAKKIIYDPITKEHLQELFTKRNITSIEAQVGLEFTTRYFAARFIPYRVQYTSEVHNPNFPQLAIHASNEKLIEFSGGMPLDFLSKELRDFQAGSSIRLIERNYVHSSFTALDPVANISSGSQLVNPKTQYGILLEPALAWTPKHLILNPRVSLGLTNLGKAWPADPLYPNLIDLNLGLGMEPELPYGKLMVGLDVLKLNRSEDFYSRLRLGAAYQFGLIQMMGGVHSRALTSGVIFSYDLIKIGVCYEFIRSDLSEGPLQNKISTEFGVRL